jgi:hypothetical protein
MLSTIILISKFNVSVAFPFIGAATVARTVDYRLWNGAAASSLQGSDYLAN